MTKARDRSGGRRSLVAGALLAAGMLAGCSSTSMDSAASLGLAERQVDLPASAPTPEGRQGTSAAPLAATQPRTVPQAEGPVNTGSFPNLNVPPKTAAPQLTAAERARKQAEIRAEQRGQSASAGAAVRNQTSELARLGATHANQTLKEIEDAADEAKKVVPDEGQ